MVTTHIEPGTHLDRPVGSRRPTRFHHRQRAGNPIRSHVLPTLHRRAEPTAQLTAYLPLELCIRNRWHTYYGRRDQGSARRGIPGATTLGTHRLLTGPSPAALSRRTGSSSGGFSAAKYAQVTLLALGTGSTSTSRAAAGPSVATTIDACSQSFTRRLAPSTVVPSIPVTSDARRDRSLGNGSANCLGMPPYPWRAVPRGPPQTSETRTGACDRRFAVRTPGTRGPKNGGRSVGLPRVRIQTGAGTPRPTRRGRRTWRATRW